MNPKTVCGWIGMEVMGHERDADEGGRVFGLAFIPLRLGIHEASLVVALSSSSFQEAHKSPSHVFIWGHQSSLSMSSSSSSKNDIVSRLLTPLLT